MEPLNYLRQATQFLEEKLLPRIAKRHPTDAEACTRILRIANSQHTQKFVLPMSGRIFNDKLKGLPSILRLPYDSILIEYPGSGKKGLVEAKFDKTCPSLKRIVLALQPADHNAILIYSIIHTEFDEEGTHFDGWVVQPYVCAIEQGEIGTPPPSGQTAIPGVTVQFLPMGTMAFELSDWKEHAYYNMMDEANAVLELIEALSCSNVTHDALPVRKQNKKAAKRGALPFDEYRVLTIRSSSSTQPNHTNGNLSFLKHRSPREHLRRGHIRTYADGRKIWVQNCVVNAGTDGVINKQYNVK